MGERAELRSTSQLIEGPPPADQSALARISKIVNLRSIDLICLDFSVLDQGPIPVDTSPTPPPSGTGVDVDYQISADVHLFGCVFTFITEVPGENGWDCSMSYRMLYDIEPDESLSDTDLQQFLWWDALITVWPFYREQLISTVQRAGLPKFVVATLPALTTASD